MIKKDSEPRNGYLIGNKLYIKNGYSQVNSAAMTTGEILIGAGLTLLATKLYLKTHNNRQTTTRANLNDKINSIGSWFKNYEDIK